MKLEVTLRLYKERCVQCVKWRVSQSDLGIRGEVERVVSDFIREVRGTGRSYLASGWLMMLHDRLKVEFQADLRSWKLVVEDTEVDDTKLELRYYNRGYVGGTKRIEPSNRFEHDEVV